VTVSQPIVLFDGVWKKFKKGERHDSLRDLIPAIGKRIWGKPDPGRQLSEREFWALKEVSFQVEPGQALGIIGPNGAGKSTTLKLLTRILKPNEGHCALKGRVGALIEVAAGFHGDLTGRENVYLQGAIMGMRRSELRDRFDEIVEFSGISSFIDTPVKRYSSGMNARLGFSIAAHLQPEILIIDEVLAVGDLQFQRKAFSKIASVVKSGVAAVIVSHQLEQVAELCGQAVLLEAGSVAKIGTPSECIKAYLWSAATGSAASSTDTGVTFSSLHLSSAQLKAGEKLFVTIEGQLSESWDSSRHVVSLKIVSSETGTHICSLGSDRVPMGLEAGQPFSTTVELTMNLNGGNFLVQAYVWDTWSYSDAVVGPSSMLRIEQSESMWGLPYLHPNVPELRTAANEPRVRAELKALGR
jgi:lipopolysaccharide transport system ATP-binding protein